MSLSVSPSIDNLEQTWASLDALLASLSEDEWKRPTGCPGWTVQDNVSHLIDYESRALGRPAPEGSALQRPHTKNALGEGNEVGVDHRRGLAGSAVLDELREITTARLAQLRSLTEEDLQREVVTPAGPGTLADMLKLRVMDTWSHEQDIRRAVGRPGNETGPTAHEAVAYFAQFLPIVVAKRAGAPDGSVVVIEAGDVWRGAIAVDGGRARILDEVPTVTTVRLR